jgi:hypothetical protein
LDLFFARSSCEKIRERRVRSDCPLSANSGHEPVAKKKDRLMALILLVVLICCCRHQGCRNHLPIIFNSSFVQIGDVRFAPNNGHPNLLLMADLSITTDNRASRK